MSEVAPAHPRHHVLLVGIDAYAGGRALRGCVNDIDAIQHLCLERAGIPPSSITRLAAPSGPPAPGPIASEAPTLDNLRRALQKLGSDDVHEGDRVFIYYAGHGTQALVGPTPATAYQREALVPSDFLADGKSDRLLFDWELNELLIAIGKRTRAVTVVLDCCCAAGATRGPGEAPMVSERYLRLDPAHRVDTLVAPAPVRTRGDVRTRGISGLLRGLDVCQVIAACRDTERARESAAEGQVPHGELTRALVAHLATVPDAELGDVRWSRVWNAVEADVRAASPRQHPWLYGSLGRRILGLGDDDDSYQPGIGITADATGFRVDAGTLAGLTEKAELAIYGEETRTFSRFNTTAERGERLGLVRVVEADDSRSTAVAKGPIRTPLPPGARAHLVKPGPGARLRLHVDPSGAAEVRRAAADFVELVDDVKQAEAYLRRAADGGWDLLDDLPSVAIAGEDPRPVVTLPAAYRQKLRLVLEHYHAFRQPYRLAKACRDLPSQLRLTILACPDRLARADAQLAPLDPVPAAHGIPFAVRAGDPVCLEVHNASVQELAVTVVDASSAGNVVILGAALVAPETRHRFWDLGDVGKPFPSYLPAGFSAGVDRLVAIGTSRLDHDLRYLARRLTWQDLIYGRGTPPRSGGDGPDLWTSDITALSIYA